MTCHFGRFQPLSMGKKTARRLLRPWLLKARSWSEWADFGDIRIVSVRGKCWYDVWLMKDNGG